VLAFDRAPPGECPGYWDSSRMENAAVVGCGQLPAMTQWVAMMRSTPPLQEPLRRSTEACFPSNEGLVASSEEVEAPVIHARKRS
jgi:hypothetical protein